MSDWNQMDLDQSLQVYKATCHQGIKLTELVVSLKFHTINNYSLLSVVEGPTEKCAGQEG